MTLQVAADETLHDALSGAGIEVPSDCREGLCGTCEARVTEGEIDHRDKVFTKQERAAGDKILTCCSRAKGDRLVLAL